MVSTLSLAFVSLLKLAVLANAQGEPLASKSFAYTDLPYQASGADAGPRGPQSGYNICNSTTEGPNSMCQTLLLNSLDDFCMWSSNLNTGTDTIGDGEAREVAWCTKKGHGSRIIPEGALTGVQWLYAKNYIQVVGHIDQTKVGLTADDQGGELDPHGADQQGNPLGGLVYTNGFGMNSQKFVQQLQSNSTPSNQYTQVVEWINFIGGGVFCLKMCNPQNPNDAALCNHIYDRIGCTYNALADYAHIDGKFEVCDSEDMTPPGVYENNGVTTTWFQGPEGEPVSAPYTPTIPSSSNCQTFSSQQLYGGPTSTSSSGAQQTGGASNGSGTRSGGNPQQTDNGAALSASSSFTTVAVGVIAAAISMGMLLVF